MNKITNIIARAKRYIQRLGLCKVIDNACTNKANTRNEVWLVAPHIERTARASTPPAPPPSMRAGVNAKWPPERMRLMPLSVEHHGDDIMMYCTGNESHVIRCTPLVAIEFVYVGTCMETYRYDDVLVARACHEGRECDLVTLVNATLVSSRK